MPLPKWVNAGTAPYRLKTGGEETEGSARRGGKNEEEGRKTKNWRGRLICVRKLGVELLLYKFGEERGEIGLPRVMERKGGKEKGSLPFL